MYFKFRYNHGSQDPCLLLTLFSAFCHAQRRTEPIEFRGWLQVPAIAKWKGRAVCSLLPYLFLKHILWDFTVIQADILIIESNRQIVGYFSLLFCLWKVGGFVLQEPIFTINLIVRTNYFTINEYYYEIWGCLDQGKD